MSNLLFLSVAKTKLVSMKNSIIGCSAGQFVYSFLGVFSVFYKASPYSFRIIQLLHLAHVHLNKILNVVALRLII